MCQHCIGVCSAVFPQLTLSAATPAEGLSLDIKKSRAEMQWFFSIPATPQCCAQAPAPTVLSLEGWGAKRRPQCRAGRQVAQCSHQGDQSHAPHGHDPALAAGSGKTAMRGQCVDTFKKLASMTHQNEVYITAWIRPLVF